MRKAKQAIEDSICQKLNKIRQGNEKHVLSVELEKAISSVGYKKVTNALTDDDWLFLLYYELDSFCSAIVHSPKVFEVFEKRPNIQHFFQNPQRLEHVVLRTMSSMTVQKTSAQKNSEIFSYLCKLSNLFSSPEQMVQQSLEDNWRRVGWFDFWNASFLGVRGFADSFFKAFEAIKGAEKIDWSDERRVLGLMEMRADKMLDEENLPHLIKLISLTSSQKDVELKWSKAIFNVLGTDRHKDLSDKIFNQIFNSKELKVLQRFKEFVCGPDFETKRFADSELNQLKFFKIFNCGDVLLKDALNFARFLEIFKKEQGYYPLQEYSRMYDKSDIPRISNQLKVAARLKGDFKMEAPSADELDFMREAFQFDGEGSDEFLGWMEKKSLEAEFGKPDVKPKARKKI